MVKTKLNNYMATDKVVIEGSSGVTASQLSELFRQIGNGNLKGFHIQQILDHKDPFGLHNLNDKRIWAYVYELCGVEFSFHKYNWEIKSDEWTIPVDVGMTPKRIVEAMRGLGVQFKLCCEDLDAHLLNDRQASGMGPYLVNFRTQVESEKEFESVSVNSLREKSICGITLTERLLLEFAFYLFTGKHLDNSQMTLCSGSEYNLTQGHHVPVVYYESTRVRIGIVNPFVSLEKLSTRKVKSIHLVRT